MLKPLKKQILKTKIFWFQTEDWQIKSFSTPIASYTIMYSWEKHDQKNETLNEYSSFGFSAK